MKRILCCGLLFVSLCVTTSCSKLMPTQYEYNLKKSQVTEERDNYLEKEIKLKYFDGITTLDVQLDGRITILEIEVKETSMFNLNYEIKQLSGSLTIELTDNRRWRKQIVSLDNQDKKSNVSIELDKGHYCLKFIGDNAQFVSDFSSSNLSSDIEISFTNFDESSMYHSIQIK